MLVNMIKSVGVNDKDINTIIGIVDKVGKVTHQQVRAELDKYGVAKLLDAKPIVDGEFKQLWEILKQMDVAQYCEFSPFLARGLNIYTGTVWEVYDKKGRLSGAIGAGGRYDEIIGNFIDNGQKYPAVGLSFGLEPICAILEMDKSNTNQANGVDVMIVPMGTEVQSQLFAEKLRTAGLRVLVNLAGKSVGKLFEYANAENIPFVIVLGENEIGTGNIKIKRMRDGEQHITNMNDITAIAQYIKGKK